MRFFLKKYEPHSAVSVRNTWYRSKLNEQKKMIDVLSRVIFLFFRNVSQSYSWPDEIFSSSLRSRGATNEKNFARFLPLFSKRKSSCWWWVVAELLMSWSTQTLMINTASITRGKKIQLREHVWNSALLSLQSPTQMKKKRIRIRWLSDPRVEKRTVPYGQ